MAASEPAPEQETLRSFLEDAAPGQTHVVTGEIDFNSDLRQWEVHLPAITLYCESEDCDDTCFFDPLRGATIGYKGMVRAQVFARYRCRHCKVKAKVYALSVLVEAENRGSPIHVLKYGEDPPAVGRTPRALQDLLDDQWPLYLQGRKAEIAGLGIGAFVYYRRVIEHTWKRVLEMLLRVATIDGSAERIATLTAAQRERDFTRSMEAAKGAVPASLYVDGHNPFQALYDTCSEGLHEQTDEECIAHAKMMRLVLTRFSDRAKAVLSEDKEFRHALGGIAAKKRSGPA